MGKHRITGYEYAIDKNRRLVNERKAVPCLDCGRTYPYYIMELDHRPGEVKKFELWKRHKRSTESVIQELLKCDAVCANCHRERTHSRGYSK